LPRNPEHSHLLSTDRPSPLDSSVFKISDRAHDRRRGRRAGRPAPKVCLRCSQHPWGVPWRLSDDL